MIEHLREPVRQVLEMLANRDYGNIVQLTNGERLSADEIRQAVEAYGRKLIVPPKQAYEEMDAIEIRGTSPPSWSVRMPLWTKEDGRSDLTVELTITDLAGQYEVELDDIHAL